MSTSTDMMKKYGPLLFVAVIGLGVCFLLFWSGCGAVGF